MPIIRDFPHLLHGGDYNPDQWLHIPGTVDADFRLMDEAGCNAFSVGIFSWAQLEPEEGQFVFDWLDDLFDRAQKTGKRFFLATPSGGRPGWLACNYPETNRVDDRGLRAPWHTRHNHCWTSPVMRARVKSVNEQLARRYGRHPALGGWHISNEYHGACFCDLCLAEFAKFLENRYGTLKRLNEAYWSAFWSHTFTDWRQVNPRDTSMDTARLDWFRFNSQQVADFLAYEISAVRPFSDAPATTNMMGFYADLDYWRLARHCDFISDDCYPQWLPGEIEDAAGHYAMVHAMHYSMLNKPFLIMESCPGRPNYHRYPRMRRPGELEREALLALGHGADGTMYFQWRKGLGNCEKIHGAVVGHDGGSETMVFKDVADVGRKLVRSAEIVDARRAPQAAVVFDWESTWAMRTTRAYGEAAERTVPQITEHHLALWRHNSPLAVVESDCDFTPYRLLVAPTLFMMKPGVPERLAAFVKGGGTLVMTYLSAYVDENNHCFRGGNPGGVLRELFGVWNEDIDGMAPVDKRGLRLTGLLLSGGRSEFAVTRLAEYLHAESAEVMGVYTDDFMNGVPALTVKRHGAGAAWYIGAQVDGDFLTAFYGKLLSDLGIEPVLPDLPPTVRVTKRSGADADYYFLLNLSCAPQTLILPRPMADLWNDQAPTSTLTLRSRAGALLKAPRS